MLGNNDDDDSELEFAADERSKPMTDRHTDRQTDRHTAIASTHTSVALCR